MCVWVNQEQMCEWTAAPGRADVLRVPSGRLEGTLSASGTSHRRCPAALAREPNEAIKDTNENTQLALPLMSKAPQRKEDELNVRLESSPAS